MSLPASNESESTSVGSSQAGLESPGMRLWRSKRPIYLACRSAIVILILTAGLNTIWMAVQSLNSEHVHRKDLLQEYLLGRAVLDRIDPYLPLPTLAHRFLGSLPHAVFPHPTPHPPPVALLSLAIAPFTLRVAASIWLAAEIVLIGSALSLTLRNLNAQLQFRHLLGAFILLLGTDAVFYELIMGQLQAFTLLLLVLSWSCFRKARDLPGGAALGAALGLKLIGWPLVLLLLVQRRWKGALAAICTFCGLNVLAVLAIGVGPAYFYYTQVAPFVSGLYRSDPFNISLWSLGWRLFEGTKSMVQISLTAPPLVPWHAGAAFLSVTLPAVFVLLVTHSAVRMHDPEARFALVCCASALVNPIAWTHYGLLAIPAMIWLWIRLGVHGFPKTATYAALGVSTLLYIRSTQLHELAIRASGQIPATGQSLAVPFAASLVTLIPLVTLLALMYLVWRVERMEPADGDQ